MCVSLPDTPRLAVEDGHMIVVTAAAVVVGVVDAVVVGGIDVVVDAVEVNLAHV